MQITRQTTPRQIQQCLQLRFHETVDYRVASRARAGLLTDSLGRHRYAFQLLPPYIDRLKALDPQIYVNLEFNPRTGNLIFIVPEATKICFSESRRLICIDGTFLTGKFVMTLLLAVGVDANGQTTVLAWAVVESENSESWSYFVNHLKLALVEVLQEPVVFISDRDKGLASVDFGPNGVALHCCRHIKENLIKGRGGEAIARYFWRISRAKTEAKYHYHMGKLTEISPAAAAYLQQIDPATYAEAFVPANRFGHDTNDLVE